jgi:hypothetical protein
MVLYVLKQWHRNPECRPMIWTRDEAIFTSLAQFKTSEFGNCKEGFSFVKLDIEQSGRFSSTTLWSVLPK